ncbi:ATP-binding cassette domain-containing protein [Agathobaculum sp.]|uniref:ATP-binding cassette domain-containing protein n=1 Tax=Agathobaculum sp. TaxID=2048138 RepID=UPI002A7ECE8A|nr:ATP-binding cassette domain-containing protein [Agathobaculum sp.]MDY3617984.1 ATP-binding cassette domain-containing protein [Agathobaculum sp.]
MKREVLRISEIVSHSAGRLRLDHVSLLVTQGEALGVVGSNGAGKSQLAAVLSGMQKADSGVVLLNEMPANAQMLRQAGVYIARSEHLLENLTISENLFGMQAERSQIFWRKHRMRALCREVLDDFKLSAYVDTPPSELTTAVHHCLLLVRAVMQRKRFAIVENATERYSAEEQLLLLHVIQAVCRRGIAVIYTSRRMDLVQNGLHRCAILASGRIVKLIQPQQYSPAAFRAHLYGFDQSHAVVSSLSPPMVDQRPSLLSLSGIAIYPGTFLSVSDRDGTADELVSIIKASCLHAKLPVGILNDDVLDASFINQMTVLDNILLTASRKVAGKHLHVSRRMQRVIRQECATHTGLSDAQLLCTPLGLSRAERLCLLLYRYSLLGAKIYIIDRPGATRTDRAGLERAAEKLLSSGCVVFYITNGADEPTEHAGRTLFWKNSSLKEDTR